MTSNAGIRSNKLLLLVGISLFGLVILDTHQDLVAAHGLNAVEIPQANSPQPTFNTSTQTPTADPESYSSTTSARQPDLAINTGVVSANEDPQVADITSTDIAVNEWQGASFPVENFQSYTSPFGYRRSPTGGYSQEFHYGLDMAAPEGSYIRNWWSGRVVEVSDNSNCGTSVVVESGNWTHIYCHMRGHVESDANGPFLIDREGGLQIREGQEVLAGDRIGRVGMTGRTTGPHLHWGLKFNGNWVDPALVLRAMYAGQQNAYRPGNNTPVQ
jgi:murein DD-endopeptidase MepM/ murein hydrolase activator NlpD